MIVTFHLIDKIPYILHKIKEKIEFKSSDLWNLRNI